MLYDYGFIADYLAEFIWELRKEQLKKLGGMEFYDVNFSYIDNDSRRGRRGDDITKFQKLSVRRKDSTFR